MIAIGDEKKDTPIAEISQGKKINVKSLDSLSQ